MNPSGILQRQTLRRIILLPTYLLTKTIIARILTSKQYLWIRYLQKTGKILSTANPQRFNEKIQWLKLNYNDNRLPSLVDKLSVREYVADIIGPQHLIPLIGIYSSPRDIDFNLLPTSFVLKTTHDSGGVYICKNKDCLNNNEVIEFLEYSQNRNFYFQGREWPYKKLTPKIICEQYIEEKNEELKDYKVFCFGGKAQFIQVDFDRFTNHRRNIYDLDWNLIPCSIKYPSDPERIIPKPIVFDQLIAIAEKLAADFPHVRVDLYIIGISILFGELTFFHGSGWEIFYPDCYDIEFGKYIKLPTTMATYLS